MEFLNLESLFQWLVGGGALVVVSWGVSWGLEEVSWWHTLSSRVRSLLVLLTSGVLGVGAQYFILNPDILANFAPYIMGFVGTIIAWLTTQKAHNVNPSRISDNE